MKTLSTTKINAYLAYLNTNLKPSEYASADEMQMIVNDVRPLLRDASREFAEIEDKTKDLRVRLASGAVSQKDANKEAQDLNKRSQELELTVGEETIDIEFENDEFNKFFNFFARVGKEWFSNAERFMAFESDLNEANRQSKKGKKSKKEETEEE